MGGNDDEMAGGSHAGEVGARGGAAAMTPRERRLENLLPRERRLEDLLRCCLVALYDYHAHYGDREIPLQTSALKEEIETELGKREGEGY
jgi:hypothetical protein